MKLALLRSDASAGTLKFCRATCQFLMSSQTFELVSRKGLIQQIHMYGNESILVTHPVTKRIFPYFVMKNCVSISAKFIIVAMFLTALSLVQAILTLRIFFHTPLQPVPTLVKKVFLEIIGPKLGFAGFIKKTRQRGMSVLHQCKFKQYYFRYPVHLG